MTIHQDPGQLLIRPLLHADVASGVEVADQALREAGTRYGWSSLPRDEASRQRSRRRHEHLLRTDPRGAWAAELNGALVGVALALRRGPLWFLSLLAVSPDHQAQGVGGRLLDAALRTADDAPAGLIMSSSDPKALRRYSQAGFSLLPGYDARGTVDRSLLPAVPTVREGDLTADAGRVDDLGRRLRGAAYGPDLPFLAESGSRLLLADGGFALVRDRHLVMLGATSPATAQSLLWAALAESDGELELGPLTGAQQWAVDVALQARLQLRPGTSLCTRGAIGPLTPYMPSGAYG